MFGLKEKAKPFAQRPRGKLGFESIHLGNWLLRIPIQFRNLQDRDAKLQVPAFG